MRYYQYFDRIDEGIPVPAPDKVIKDFNKHSVVQELVLYLDKPLNDVITSITFEAVADGYWSHELKTDVNLYTTINAKRELSMDEKEKLINYLTGQYADGWGENGFDYRDGSLQVWWDDMPELEFVTV
jgi:hypothetical protein